MKIKKWTLSCASDELNQGNNYIARTNNKKKY